MGVLEAASDYVTQAQLTRAFDGVPDVPSLVAQLLHVDFLVERGSVKDKADRALDKGWAWGPAARFFHYRTQSVPYEEDLDKQRASIVALDLRSFPPLTAKASFGRYCASVARGANLVVHLFHCSTSREFWDGPGGAPPRLSTKTSEHICSRQVRRAELATRLRFIRWCLTSRGSTLASITTQYVSTRCRCFALGISRRFVETCWRSNHGLEKRPQLF